MTNNQINELDNDELNQVSGGVGWFVAGALASWGIGKVMDKVSEPNKPLNTIMQPIK